MPAPRAESLTTLRVHVTLQTAWRILDIRCAWFQTVTSSRTRQADSISLPTTAEPQRRYIAVSIAMSISFPVEEAHHLSVLTTTYHPGEQSAPETADLWA